MKKHLNHPILLIGLVVLALVIVFLIFDRKRILNEASETASQTNQNDASSTTGGQPLSVDQRLKGCDISHWDGTIDWASLKGASISFVFIKATQGTTYIDPDFEYNWASADSYGFYRGAYHFYQPNEDPKEQAAHFLSVAKPSKGDLLPVLDIEVSDNLSPAKLAADIGIWIDSVKAAIGRYPIIYTDHSFWNGSVDADFGHCPLWIAEWETDKPPLLPKGWSRWIFWQYADNGTLAGIPDAQGKVDLDYFYGDEQSIKNYRLK